MIPVTILKLDTLTNALTDIQNARDSLVKVIDEGTLNAHAAYDIRSMIKDLTEYITSLQEEIDRREANPDV